MSGEIEQSDSASRQALVEFLNCFVHVCAIQVRVRHDLEAEPAQHLAGRRRVARGVGERMILIARIADDQRKAARMCVTLLPGSGAADCDGSQQDREPQISPHEFSYESSPHDHTPCRYSTAPSRSRARTA